LLPKELLSKVLVFDGAMGTLLQQNGLAPGACPELLNLQNPALIKEIHTAYLKSGADIITTNTFGGNRLKLAAYDLAHLVAEINRQGVACAREAIINSSSNSYVVASIGPTGRFLEPLGTVTFAEMYQVFQEQIAELAGANPDFLLLETFSDLGEVRAALLAAKDTCDIPVICSLTYTGLRTLTGVSPASAAVVLTGLGAAAIGANCSGGPKELLPVMQELAENTVLPLMVQPNAGLPTVREGQTFYPLDPQMFLDAMEPYFALGINMFGSCCGSTPEYTQLLKKRLSKFNPPPRRIQPGSTLASKSMVVRLGDNLLPKLIGDRINPTGRKSLAAALRKGDLTPVRAEAEAQVAAGAHLLDINVGIAGIKQAAAMREVVNLLQQSLNTPLVIDSTEPKVIAQALEAYHGKALVNSVNGEPESLHSILPLCKRYGAAVVGLTLDEKGIPECAEGRLAIAAQIIAACTNYGIPQQDIYIDCLALTVANDTLSAQETLRAIKLIKDRFQVNTILGISNVSYGLPNRWQINSAFLAMALAQGLDAAIIDPLDPKMVISWQASALLAGRDPQAANYLRLNTENQSTAAIEKATPLQKPSIEQIPNLVIKGSPALIEAVQALLREGIEPQTIINEGLTPGLKTVGDKFEQGDYYLPQLMLSAQVAQQAFSLVQKQMKNQDITTKGTIIIGTVKGDIHDIGKNIVAALMKTHGFRVIDLGKNVPAEAFLAAAQREEAQIVALSSLMTTTMAYLQPTIEKIKANLPTVKVIVGGAVVTEEYAQAIGADGYGKDAVSAVKLVEKLQWKQKGE
jgi:5-methyltetrahydrofolate--homocysteine methyltransferase